MVGRSRGARNSATRISTPPAPPSRHGTRISQSLDGQPGGYRHAPAPATNTDVSASKTTSSSLSPSTVFDVRRKPAPVVPKKPAILSTSSAGPDRPRNGISEGSQTQVPNSHKDEDCKSNRRFNRAFPTPPSPPHRRTNLGMTVPKTDLVSSAPKAMSDARRDNKCQQPPSVPKSPSAPLSGDRDSGTSQRDLLDEDNNGARAIPSLQPSRPC